jgi:hypothetical protein
LKLQGAYRNFFIKSEEGRAFVEFIESLINSEHEKAENKPELARDHAQRAKGMREVLNHINVTCIEKK